MSLDLHNDQTKELLSSISEEQYALLRPIIDEFKNWTGIEIDQYNDIIIPHGLIATWIRVIDQYTKETNLNINKEKTSAILEFKGLLRFCQLHNIDIEFLGD